MYIFIKGVNDSKVILEKKQEMNVLKYILFETMI